MEIDSPFNDTIQELKQKTKELKEEFIEVKAQVVKEEYPISRLLRREASHSQRLQKLESEINQLIIRNHILAEKLKSRNKEFEMEVLQKVTDICYNMNQEFFNNQTKTINDWFDEITKIGNIMIKRKKKKKLDSIEGE